MTSEFISRSRFQDKLLFHMYFTLCKTMNVHEFINKSYVESFLQT